MQRVHITVKLKMLNIVVKEPHNVLLLHSVDIFSYFIMILHLNVRDNNAAI